VLLVSPSAKAAGAERALAGLARHLPGHGWHPTAVLLESGPLEDWLTSAGCPTAVLSAHRTRQLHRSVSTVTRVAQLIRSTRADVVLSNMDKGHIFGGSAAALVRRPAVLWQHGIPTLWHGLPRERMATVAAVVPKASVLASCDAAVRAQRALTKAPVHKVFPGIDIGEVTAASGRGQRIRVSLGWRDNIVIGVVGRLQVSKGQHDFLDAASLLSRDYPRLRFCVVGGAILGWEGSYEADLRARAEGDRLLRDRVFFAGHQEDVYAWIDALDIVVHASFGEGFGLVLVEALALGKALVATNVGEPSEIVIDGVSGLLVPPRDPGSLAAAMRRLLEDPCLAEQLSAGARLRAQLFTDEHMARRVATVLDGVISPR
jgi:glycosyltransferase involved in cell wall biosynthesis